jgi:hypothetical protein
VVVNPEVIGLSPEFEIEFMIRLDWPGTDVIIFKTFSPENLAKILAIFAQTTASFCKNFIITLICKKNAIFSPKMAKIAQNCDHNLIV